MRKFWVILALAVMPLCGAAQADTIKSGASVRIEGASGSVVAVGGNVEVSGTVSPGLRPMTGVLAAGGSVSVSANIDGALAAGGGEVVFSGAAENFFGSGGNVAMSGSVAEDAMLAGGNLMVTKGAVIGNDLYMAGASLDVSGRIENDAELAGASVTFNGDATGDVTIDAEDVVIGPEARIGGEFAYFSPKEAQISPSAVIEGSIVRNEARGERYKIDKRGPGFVGGKSMTARAYGALFWFVALGASGALMMLVFPRWMGRTAMSGRERPIMTMLIGAGVLILMPITAIVFMAVILGIPFGAFLLSLYFGLMMVSMIGAGLAVGHLLIDRSGDEQAKFLPFLAGLAIVLILGAVPYIGALLSLVAMLIGLGSLFSGLWAALRSPAGAVA